MNVNFFLIPFFKISIRKLCLCFNEEIIVAAILNLSLYLSQILQCCHFFRKLYNVCTLIHLSFAQNKT